MNKKLKSLIITICVLGLVVLYGCAAVSNVATPCFISEDVIEYSGEKPTSILPWTTLYDAERIDKAMDFMHLIKQRDLERAMDDDYDEYTYIKSIQNEHTASARQIKETVFTPTGPVGLALTTLFGGTMGALLIPRPGDKKKSA